MLTSTIFRSLRGHGAASWTGLHRVPTTLLRQRTLNALYPLDWARCLSTDGGKEKKLSKRKVAMVAGYLGTGYHGVQLNKNVETIENELRRAILEVGAMRESNFVDLAKIDWSRSSRTDKGVHAACLVFAGKLLIDENRVNGRTGRVRGLTDALNAALPPTIRIFSSTRVNKRFSARKACVLREYEYFMPLSFFKDSTFTQRSPGPFVEEQVLDKFFTALRKYEGIHDFHNFTKSRSHFYKLHARLQHQRARNAAQGSWDEDRDEAENDEDAEDIDLDDEYAPENFSQFEGPDAKSRKVLLRHRRTIYSCSGSLLEDFCGEPYVRVHIVGQAFLLHQIRYMVGGALAVATGGISTDTFDAALKTNRIIRVPIAPAEGLVLLSSSFGGKLHTVSLFEDFNTQLAQERKDLSHRVLLTPREEDEMVRFRETTIYPEVARAWNGETNLERWQAYLERSYESNDSLDHADIRSALEEVQQEQTAKKERQQAMVQQNRIEHVHQNAQRSLMPKQFTTKFCVRYSIAPGIFTSDLRRGLARHLREGRMPLNADEEQLFAYIDKVGVQKLAAEGRQLRLSIRK
ncbi:TPA: hypothetical protein N0F65_002491 [Lagenidium giganteum]|uniref:Pseudouridine synthase I TruA alpha/beta domain-containing protein n=1 Tax=Lagenidium giganteum TaxID=4803 RepID=A0AAV2YWY8_9STRA|nr:TPA: hypothetical protein N0F65_002491 [Lagenidium giganteum]